MEQPLSNAKILVTDNWCFPWPKKTLQVLWNRVPGIPETSILNAMARAVSQDVEDVPWSPPGDTFDWWGQWHRDALVQVLSFTAGTADIFLAWPSGHMEICRVVEGMVEFHEVEIKVAGE